MKSKSSAHTGESQYDFPFLVMWLIASVISSAIGGVLGSAVGENVGFALGELLAWPVTTVLGLVGSDSAGQALTTLAGNTTAGLFSGATTGLIIGVAQWIVLRLRLPRTGWWMLATPTGLALSGGLASLVGGLLSILSGGGPLIFLGLLMIPVASVLLGVLQWLVLRRKVQRAGWWVLVVVVAVTINTLVAGVGLGLGGLIDLVGNPILDACVGLAVGLATGAITGVPLVWLLRRPTP